MDPKEINAWIKLLLTVGALIAGGAIFTEQVRDGLDDLSTALESRVQEVDHEHARFESFHEQLQKQADRALYIACLAWDAERLPQCLPPVE